MDTEQLKLIIDLLRDAGATTAWIAGAYIAAPIVETILVASALLAAFSCGMRTVRHTTDANNRCAKAWIAAAAAAGYGSADALPTEREIARVVEMIRANRAA